MRDNYAERDGGGNALGGPGSLALSERFGMSGWDEEITPQRGVDLGPGFLGDFDRSMGIGATTKSASPFLQVLERQMVLSGAEKISKPYREAGFAYACIRAFASAIFQLPLVIRTSRDPKAPEVNENDPVRRLFKSPNSHQTLSQLLEAGVTHRKLDGEDVWFLWGPNAEPIEPGLDGRIDLPTSIIAVRGRDVCNIRQDARGLPIEYEFPRKQGVSREDAKPKHFKSEAVVHFRNYDPDNPLRGLGEVEVALRDLAIEFQAQRYNEAILRHGGDPGGFVIRETKPVGVNVDAENRELQDLTSQPSNRGKWKVLYGKGIKIEQTRISPKDLEFGQMLTWTRDKTCTIVGCPPPIIGIMDRTIFRNMEVAERFFWKGGSGVMAYLASFLDTLNNFFFPRLRRGAGMTGDPSKYHAEFDTSGVAAIQVDVSEKIRIAMEASQGSTGASFSELLALQGVAHDPNADWETKSMPSGRVLLEDFLAGNTAIADEPDEPEEEEDDEESDGEEEELAIEFDLERPGAARRRAVDESGDSRSPLAGGTRSLEAKRVQPDTKEGDARYQYLKDYEARVFKPRTTALKSKVRKWLRKYQLAQVARLEDFAERGWEAIPADERSLEGAQQKTGTIGPDDIVAAGSVSEADLQILLLNRKEWEETLRDAVSPVLAQTFEAASADVATEIAGSFLTLQDPEVIAFLETQEIQLVEGVNSRLAQRIRVGLLNEFQGATNVGRLQELVRELLPDLRDSVNHLLRNRDARAQRIARTETAHASNGARFKTMKRNGVLRHEWATAEDDAVRDKAPKGGTISHVDLDGEVRNLGDEFDRNLTHPSDPEAPVGHVANCRCIARPLLDEEDDDE